MNGSVPDIKALTRRFGAFAAGDALRTSMLVGGVRVFGLGLDHAVIILATTLMVLSGARLYQRLAT